MAFEIVPFDFLGKDIPLTDKLNALYFTLAEAYHIAADALDPEDERLDTLLVAKNWFDAFIDEVEKIDSQSYNDLEKRMSATIEKDEDKDDNVNKYDEWTYHDTYEDEEDWELDRLAAEDLASWEQFVDDDPPSAEEVIGSDE